MKFTVIDFETANNRRNSACAIGLSVVENGEIIEEMSYLMGLGGNKPVIEYCGGTEVGGGYVTSTVVQPNIPSTFSSQALGGEFVLIDETGKVGPRRNVPDTPHPRTLISIAE